MARIGLGFLPVEPRGGALGCAAGKSRVGARAMARSGAPPSTGSRRKTQLSPAGMLVALSSALLAACPGGTPTVDSRNLTEPRAGHTATLLPSGQVMIAGGDCTYSDHCSIPSFVLATAELYDPAMGSWSRTGSLAYPRREHTATILATGQVLVIGGLYLVCQDKPPYYCSLAVPGVELYDPLHGLWVTRSPASNRFTHTATLLPTGKVLVVGTGFEISENRPELYDPVTNEWTATSLPSTTNRSGHTATLLPSGKVLVTGGGCTSSAVCPIQSTSSELYDTASDSWSMTGAPARGRTGHTATLLDSGRVLVVGGVDLSVTPPETLSSAESYDPETGTWSATGSLATARASHTATLLPSGKVLVAGGFGGTGSLNDQLDSLEIYDLAAGTWRPAGSLATARALHTATLLLSGKVLFAGGFGNQGLLASVELYQEK